MNQDNKAYTEEKSKWIKNNTELMQVIEWTDRDIKASSHVDCFPHVEPVWK